MDTTSHRPTSAELATLIAMADSDEVVRLRLLRAIRDLASRKDISRLAPSAT
jgi:hypothetical protein